MPSSIGMQLPQTRLRQRRRRALGRWVFSTWRSSRPFPAQGASLDTAYRDYLAKKGLAESDPGVAGGSTAAAGMLVLRANDGRVPNPLPPPFTGENAIGVWRPTTSYQPPPPPSGAPMATPWLGAVPCFTLQSGDQFRAKPPPALNSQQYATDYNEVKALGAHSNSARTPEQTELAFFVLWHRALRDVAAAHVKDIRDNARLLALANLAMADAVITAGTAKNTMFCGDRSRPFKRARTTATRRRLVTPPGSRF
jgi:hypothetical protein